MSAVEQTISKVGRHRIYSNEQRKDRNRKAQAAFRDRRSQYTKNLEAALLELEKKANDLKTSNSQMEERAKTAEARCAQLTLEVNSLHKLLGLALVNTHLDSSAQPLNSDIKPLSPIDSCPALDMSSPESLFDSSAVDCSWLNTDQYILPSGDIFNNTWYEVNPEVTSSSQSHI